MAQQLDQSESTLAAYLSDHDVPCVRCGYNLRGSTADRCSECGTAVQLVDDAGSRMSYRFVLLIWCAAWLGGFGFYIWWSANFAPRGIWAELSWFAVEERDLIRCGASFSGAIGLPLSILVLIFHRDIARCTSKWLVIWTVPFILGCGVVLLLFIIG